MWRLHLLLAWGLAFANPYVITDHPDRRKVEEPLAPQGQPRPEAISALPSQRSLPREREPRRWTLSTRGVPCHPFKDGEKTYPGCHPEGWCCLDVSCSKTADCDVSGAALDLPLQLPKDPVTQSCELETLEGKFFWDPMEEDINLMFVLLQDDVEGLEEEELKSLVELCKSMPLRLVLMSYKTSQQQIQQLMSSSQQQLERMVAPLTLEEQAQVRQKIILATEPAWHVSFNSCWLPSVTFAWSEATSLLRFSSKDGVLESTRPQSIRGEWAQDAQHKELSLPLRWAGGLCEEQEMDPRWPAANNDLAGFIALVARGSCSHYHKARSAQDLGAAGIVIFSHNDQPVAMSCAAPDPCDETLKIPVLMTTRSLGEQLLEEMFPNATDSPESDIATVVATLTAERQGPNLVGVLGYGGGLWYNSPIGLSGLADELLGMDYRRRALRRRAEFLEAQGEVLRIDVFQRAAFPGGLTAPWKSSDAQRILDKGYTELDIELALECKDHLDDNCPPWDHELNLYLCIEGVSDQAACHDRRVSVGRWITAYGREALWLSSNTAALPLLSSREAVEGRGTLHLHTWQHYTVSLTFWFHGADAELLPSSQMPLWQGGPFDMTYNPLHEPITFQLPPNTQQVTLSALITGHGWGVDDENCAEFCDHSHHFAVNGRGEPSLSQSYPTAGSEEGCKTKVSLGVVPNQYGTWPFGRAGWCPGQQVEWFQVDVTQWLQPGSNSISYQAFFNGTSYDPQPRDAGDAAEALGFPAEIHVASVLTFHRVRGAEPREPVELLLGPRSQERSDLFP